MTKRLLTAAALAAAAALALAPAGSAHVRTPRVSTPTITEVNPANLAVVKRVFYARGSGEVGGRGAPGLCPGATTCAVYKLGKTRWSVGDGGRLTIPLRYSDSGRPGSRAPGAGDIVQALRAAGAEWHRWNSNVTFSYAGTTSARPGSYGASCSDGSNTIGWRTMSPGVLGVASICYDTTSLRVVETDIALNAAQRWAIMSTPDRSSRTYDVQSILTHELGHYLSLLDLYSLRSRGMTMYGSSKPGTISQRTLGLGDIVAAQTAYPCGPGDSCPRTGIADD